jgi:hypothetical protein
VTVGKALAVTKRVQTGNRRNVITNLKISDAKLVGTEHETHVLNECIQHSVGAVEADTEPSVQLLVCVLCVCVCVCIYIETYCCF